MPDMLLLDGRFTIGRAIGRTVRVIGRTWGTIGLLCLVAVLAETAMVAGLGAAAAAVIPAAVTSDWRDAIEFVLTSGLQLLSGAFLVGALSHLAFAEADYWRPRLRQSVRTGLRGLLPIVALIALELVAVGTATLLLVVPGVLLFLMWLVAAPVCAVEHTGVLRALSRSVVLTKGRRWELFALATMYLMAAFMTVLLIGLLSIVFDGHTNTNFDLVLLLSSLVVAPMMFAVGVIGIAVTSIELRRTSEGGLLHQVAAVFE